MKLELEAKKKQAVVVTSGRAIAAPMGALALTLFMGCGGAAAPPATPASTPEASSAPASPAATEGDQASRGGKLYATHCAGCHGANGEGNEKAPAVVGAKALPLDAQPPSKARTSKFHTGADVFAFVKAAMPPKKPGSLTDDEYAAILAFALKANGVDLTGKTVDASTAASFVLHP